MAADRPTGKPFVTRSSAVGKSGMAATSRPPATLAAIEILKSGGNAIDAARVQRVGSSEPTGKSAEPDGGQVLVESGFAADTIREMKGRGHHIAASGGEFGGYQAIWYDPEKNFYFGATESRKDGIALGY